MSDRCVLMDGSPESGWEPGHCHLEGDGSLTGPYHGRRDDCLYSWRNEIPAGVPAGE